MNIKNQIQIGIFLFISAILPATSSSYPFLTKSAILKELGAQILIAENQSDAIVFDKDILKEYHVPVDGSDTYLISTNGLIPMKGKTSEKTLFEMCADPYPGIGFKKVDGKEIFIVTGKNLEGAIYWYPAEVITQKNQKSKCFKNVSAKNPKHSSYKSTVPAGVVQQIRWRRDLTKVELEANCRSFADWNAKLNQKYNAENMYKECLTGNHYICTNEEKLIVAFKSNDRECKEITSSSIDCDLKAGIGENLHEFLGTLVLKKGTSQETWLIWNAPGYEGEGVYAFEINDLGKKVKPSEDWLVYNGC